MAPVVNELAEKYRGKVSVRHIDANRDYELAEEFGIRGVPTYIMLDSTGEVAGKLVGGDPAWLAGQFQQAASGQ